jgi:hypothetical protein
MHSSSAYVKQPDLFQRMANMALYVQDLDRSNLQQLQAMTYDCKEELPENRVRIVLLSAEGKSVPEISRMVNLHPINVRKWIHRFQRHPAAWGRGAAQRQIARSAAPLYCGSTPAYHHLRDC